MLLLQVDDVRSYIHIRKKVMNMHSKVVTLYIGQLHPITVYRTVFGVCAVRVLSVIMCPLYYFLDTVLFRYDFHHDSCDYYSDFYGPSYHFELHA